VTVEVEQRGAAAIVTIARPERGNSLSRATLAAFGALRGTLAADPTVRAIVITGAGSRVFCAGADLKERTTMNAEQVREQLGAYRTELGWLDDCPKPVVAAINGAALGGGLELALLCDLRIAVPHAVLGLPETALAIIPGAGGTQRLPRVIGEARAAEMILLGRRLSAAEALDWGLIHRVVGEAEDLLVATLQWLEPVLAGAPIAQSAALAALNVARSHSLEQGLARELELYEECLNSEDRAEALTAFAAKRPARFQGR
jgi:enoyl-CoA hydratase/carnithine racemase